MSIRDSIDKAAERSLSQAGFVFEMDHVSTFEKIALPTGVILAQGMDAWTTLDGIANHKLREGNPVMKDLVKNQTAFVATKLAIGIGGAVLVKKLQDKGHKTAARIFAGLSTLAGAGPAISNLKLMGKL